MAIASTFLTVLSWLLTRRPKATPAQADLMFRQLVIGGIGASLGGRSGRA